MMACSFRFNVVWKASRQSETLDQFSVRQVAEIVVVVIGMMFHQGGTTAPRSLRSPVSIPDLAD